MVDQVKTFLESGDWKALSKTHADFNEARQAALQGVIAQCAKDFSFPTGKPYNVEHENFNHFALCLRSNVNLNPSLNNSKAIRKEVLGWNF